jgi:Tfp pilus assembly protein PilN
MPANNNISINLLGDSELKHTPLGRVVAWAVTYGRYIMIGTEIIVLLAFISRFSLDRKLTDLKEEISQKQDIIQANVQFERDVRTLQDKLSKIKTLTTQPVSSIDLLTFFQSIVPPGVYFQLYNVSENKLNIEATAESTNAFSQFIASLQASKIISNVDLGTVKRDPLLGIQFSFAAQVAGGKSK